MFKRSAWLLSAIVAVVCGVGIARASEAPLPWQASGAPTLQKTIELAPNAFPTTNNFDCTGATVALYASTTMRQDCLVSVPSGQVGANGFVFSGTNQSIPVVPVYPYYGLQPIPNQSLLITYSRGPIVGSYMHFYTSYRDKLSNVPQYVNGQWQYTITGKPDLSLRGSDGALLGINSEAMAFSPNGSWMVVELPTLGFVRINLATFEMLPFAPSMYQNGDYAERRAQISITNDGRSVAIKPNDFNNFRVYDLANCSGTSLPVLTTDRCANRDYLSIIAGQISGFVGIYQPRFINDSQITFAATYDKIPGSFKVAKYTLTAPGENPTGIDYLGMGDSFASGEGAFAYTSGTDTANDHCHLSTRAYGFLLSAELFASGHSVACSGAVMEDIIDTSLSYTGQVTDGIQRNDRKNINDVMANYTPGYIAQSEFIDMYRPEAITLSIGGNNIGFSDILTSCVEPSIIASSCYPTYEDRLELARTINGTFDRLVDTYRTVARPGKRVYVVGYPQLAAVGGNCAVNVHLDDSEIRMASDLIDYLNLVINRAADKAGVRYVDVSDALNGHRLCETDSQYVAVNGLTAGTDSGIGPIKFIGSESYHPNAIGHDLLEKTIRARTDNLRQAMPAPNPALQAPALPSTLDTSGLPKSGRPTNIVVPDDDMAPALLVHDQNIPVLLSTGLAVLKALTSYTLVMHSDPVTLGMATTDAAGNLTASIHIPASVPPGFHTLHIYGPNMLGQPLDIVKTVYVAAASDDYNGDGTANADEPCVFVAAAGVDADKDGIDDACDGFIGPSGGSLPGTDPITNTVTLTGNSITIELAATPAP